MSLYMMNRHWPLMPWNDGSGYNDGQVLFMIDGNKWHTPCLNIDEEGEFDHSGWISMGTMTHAVDVLARPSLRGTIGTNWA